MTVPALRCASCGGTLSPEAALGPARCPYCGATSVPPPRVIERVVERVVVATPPGAADDARLRCPRCATGMPEKRLTIGFVAGCRTCAGLWLDASAVQRLRTTYDATLEEELRRPFGPVIVMGPIPNRNAALSCPTCAAPMRRAPIRETSPSGLDVCEAHGTWFDRDELGMLIDALREARAGEVTPDDLDAAGVGGGFFARLFRRG